MPHSFAHLYQSLIEYISDKFVMAWAIPLKKYQSLIEYISDNIVLYGENIPPSVSISYRVYF